MSRAQTAPEFEDDDFEFDFDGFEAPSPDDFRPGAEPDLDFEPEGRAASPEPEPTPEPTPAAAPPPMPTPPLGLRRSMVHPDPTLGAGLSFRPVPEEPGSSVVEHAFEEDAELEQATIAAAAFEPEPLTFEEPEPIDAPEPAPTPARPVAVEGDADAFAHAAGFNPVGELLAGAEAALGEVSVPRIAIHVFAENPRTLQAAERAAADRRLARATTTVRQGGIDTALEVYKSEPTPPLVVLECVQGARALLADLERLAEVCDAGTKVVVVGRDNDIALYRELMRRGVSEYLVAPVEPLGLIRTVASLYNDPAQPFVGRTLAFVGARGGTGASTVAHNTAWAIAERLRQNTVVVDLDLPFGTAGLDFNQDGQASVAEALTAPERLDPVLMDRMMVRCGERLSLLTAPASLDADYDLSPEVFDEVVQKVRGAAPFVVLDLPHAWNAWVRRMLLSADEVVVVATPDLASLRNAKNMIDLARAARPNDSPPRLVLNQVGVKDRPEIPVKDFGAAVGVQPCLVLPFDAKLFGQAANNGQMVGDVGRKSKSADGFTHLAQIVSRREPPAPESKSLFGALFKR